MSATPSTPVPAPQAGDSPPIAASTPPAGGYATVPAMLAGSQAAELCIAQAMLRAGCIPTAPASSNAYQRD